MSNSAFAPALHWLGFTGIMTAQELDIIMVGVRHALLHCFESILVLSPVQASLSLKDTGVNLSSRRDKQTPSTDLSMLACNCHT